MARFSPASEQRLIGLHPDLIRVLRRAIETFDFLIVEGVRSDEQCLINWGKGRTVAQCAAKGVPSQYAKPGIAKVTWLTNPLGSNHRKKSDGLGHAVDCAPSPLNWNDTPSFRRMADAIMTAARLEGVSLVWGGSWKSSPDMPHFELA